MAVTFDISLQFGYRRKGSVTAFEGAALMTVPTWLVVWGRRKEEAGGREESSIPAALIWRADIKPRVTADWLQLRLNNAQQTPASHDNCAFRTCISHTSYLACYYRVVGADFPLLFFLSSFLTCSRSVEIRKPLSHQPSTVLFEVFP